MVYSNLSVEARHLFRMLGLHPGQHYDIYGAAAIAGVEVVAAKRLIGDLVQAHLVTEYTYNSFKMHDLLRVYARSLAVEFEAAEDRIEATRRIWATI